MTDQIDEVLAEIDDLRDRLLRVANIIGPAYGARCCDMGLRTFDALGRVEMAVRDRDNRYKEHGPDWRIECIAKQQRDQDTLRLRNALRHKAGEAELSEAEWSTRQIRRRLRPLTVAEHFALGAELKDAQTRLTHLETTIGNMKPRDRWQEAWRRVRRTGCKLQRMRSALDSIVCREFPGGYERDVNPTQAYFGLYDFH